MRLIFLGCVYTIYSYGQISISCAIPLILFFFFFFFANLLYSLIMWLIVSSLSLHNLHLLFCCLIYSRFDIISPYGVVLCCCQRRVSFLRFPFLSHVQVFSCEISLVCYLKCLYIWGVVVVIFVLLMLMLCLLFLVTGVSLSPRFLCSLRVFVSMHRCYLQC